MAEHFESPEQTTDHQNSPVKPIPHAEHKYEDSPPHTAETPDVKGFPLRALVSELNVGLMLTRAQILFRQENYVEFEKTVAAALDISNAIGNKSLVARCCFWQGMFFEKIHHAGDSQLEHDYIENSGVGEQMIKSFLDAGCILPRKDIPEPPWPESRWLSARMQKYGSQITKFLEQEGPRTVDMSFIKEWRSLRSNQTFRSEFSDNDSLYDRLLEEIQTQTYHHDVPQPGVSQSNILQSDAPQIDALQSDTPFVPMDEFMQQRYGIPGEPLPSKSNTEEVVETSQQTQKHSPKLTQETPHDSIERLESSRRSPDTSPPNRTRAMERMRIMSRLSSQFDGYQRTESTTEKPSRPLSLDTGASLKRVIRPKRISDIHSHRRNASLPTQISLSPRSVQRSRAESLRKPSDMTDTPAHVQRKRSITENRISPSLSIDTTTHTAKPRVPSTPVHHSPLSKVVPVDDPDDEE